VKRKEPLNYSGTVIKSMALQGVIVTNIHQGNIFEAMRLVLPEHKKKMGDLERETRKKMLPVLTEDEYSEMQYKLSEALERQKSIRVYLFDPFGNSSIEGLPFIKSGHLHIKTANDNKAVPIARLIHLELLR